MENLDSLSIRKYLLSGGIWALFGKVLSVLLGLGMAALLARLLSPDDMGAYFIAYNLIYFLSVFATFGMGNTMLRYISEAIGQNRQARAMSVIRAGIILVISSTIIVASVFYFGIGQWILEYIFHSPALSAQIAFIAIWLILLTFQKMLPEIFRALQDIRLAVIVNELLVSSIVVFILACVWIFNGDLTLIQALQLILVAGTVNFFVSFWALKSKTRHFHISAKPDVTYLELFSHSYPLFISALLTTILTQSNLWILAYYHPGGGVAIYSAAWRLASSLQLPLIVVNAVVPPLIAKLYAQHRKIELERILRFTTTLAAIPSSIMLVVIIAFANFILRSLYGDYYTQGVPILILLSISQAFTVYVGSCEYTLIMTGHRKTIALLLVFLTMFGLTIGLLVIPAFGAIGAASATSFTIILIEILFWVFARKRTGMWTHFYTNPIYFVDTLKKMGRIPYLINKK